jgi:hypothetical protein
MSHTGVPLHTHLPTLQHCRTAINSRLPCQRSSIPRPIRILNHILRPSGVLPEVSGNIKKTWMNIAPLKIPKMRCTFHFMFTKAGRGTVRERGRTPSYSKSREQLLSLEDKGEELRRIDP